uniref:Uncharacterized protein n=1 Tax=Rangifer tarandus platyrhynchus TaxID=3082113 RepID=A0ACB0F6J2_RANTA|nr:unnamed protein product [Rangifer tarandus platyrhynchus]
MQPAGGRVVAPFPLLLSPRPRALVQGDRGPEGTCTPSKDALRLTRVSLPPGQLSRVSLPPGQLTPVSLPPGQLSPPSSPPALQGGAPCLGIKSLPGTPVLPFGEFRGLLMTQPHSRPNGPAPRPRSRTRICEVRWASSTAGAENKLSDLAGTCSSSGVLEKGQKAPGRNPGPGTHPGSDRRQIRGHLTGLKAAAVPRLKGARQGGVPSPGSGTEWGWGVVEGEGQEGQRMAPQKLPEPGSLSDGLRPVKGGR